MALGKLGGLAGRGAPKRRSRSHYQKAAKIRWENEKLKAKNSQVADL